jgi:hydrogenase-4 component B
MTPFVAGLALIVAGGLAAVLGRRSAAGDRWYQWLVVAGCATAVATPVRVLVSGTTQSLAVRASTPGGPWVMGVDALSAVFLVAALIVGAVCSTFGVRYLATERPHRSPWFAHGSFAALIAAIVVVLTARAVVPFLIAWEVMAIASYLLIVTDHTHAEVRRAGLTYLVLTHTATLVLFAMFALWGHAAADLSFSSLALAWPALAPGAKTGVLLLALFGFGMKTGFVPLHLWLPPAHAASPSHVSALMSGIVIKTGIYGLLRLFLMVGGAPAWWGWLVLALGTASAVLGVLWALAQHDLKRLLAYHSVENIGIILMGTGIGALGVAYRSPGVAVLGFAGAVLHTVNHALFKSLLFLGAGTVYRATGTRNIEELGGLARSLPLTWLGFAVGATAIIGVPPLNGFVSEWLVYRGFFAAESSGEGALRLALLGVPALALVGALALACFAKVAGVVFLGTARSARQVTAVDREPGLAAPMLFLAATCITLGVVPVAGVWLVGSAARDLGGQAGDFALRASADAAAGISVVAAAVAGLASALWLGRWALLRHRSVRYEPTWSCAYQATTPRMQYTASSFAAPVLALFGRLSGVHSERSADSLHTHPRDLVLDGIALPVWNAIRRAALRLRPIQQGRLSLYLVYVMAALLGLLAYLAIGIRR